VIKTCEYCGAVHGDPSGVCHFCDVPLGSSGRAPIPNRVAPATEGNLAVDPEWRREVSTRLQDYRVRRRGTAVSDLQTALPFESFAPIPVESHAVETELVLPAPPRQAHGPRKLRNERFEIPIPRMETVPHAGHAHGPVLARHGAHVGHERLHSVASLTDRRKAAVRDAALLLVSYGGILGFFAALGGHIGLNKIDLAVTGATFAVFYAQYFALFTFFGGRTPGMMLCGLRVVGFDGGTPTLRQMAWRSFGYLISAGTCFLGFVWALLDEEGLCWQDRISETYLTPIQPETQTDNQVA
jgi:hypothetical protein